MLSATLDKIRLDSIEEGKKEGKKEGITELIKIYLMTRFGEAPAELLQKLKRVEKINELERLATKIYNCRDLNEVEKLLL